MRNNHNTSNLGELICLICNSNKGVCSKIYLEINGCRLEKLKNAKLMICNNCGNIELLTTRFSRLSSIY
jgi:hypothetical protein